MVPETNIDNSFPVGNLVIYGFSTPYRLDRDSNGGTSCCTLEKILLLTCLPRTKKTHIEIVYVELNLHNEK